MKHCWQPLIEGMLEAVVLVDTLDLRIVAVNQAAEALLQAKRSELVGEPVVNLAATPEDMFFWEEVAAGQAERIVSDTFLNCGDGETRQVTRRVTVARFENGPAVYVLAMHDRSEQLRVEGELETLLAELQATLESTADGILVTDNAGAIRGYNQRFAELWSLPEKLLTRQDDDAVYSWMEQCVIDKEEYVEQLAAIQRSPLAEASSVVGLRSGPVLERVTLPQYARGRPIGRVFSFRDITQRLADKSRLELAAKVFETSLDAIFITDAKQCIVAANPSFQRLTGYRQAEVIGHPPKDFLAKSEDASVCQKLLDGLSEQGFWEGELWNRRKDGEAYLCLISMVRVKDEAGCTTHFIGFFKDLTEALAARKRIEELAYHDALTGLPNRLMFSERFDFAKKVADRKQTSSAVLFIDLDRFKHINDALGHMFGDRVLIEVAERLQSCLRQVDTVSRLGGDEFLILLNDAGADGAEVTARRILQRLSAPFSLSEIAFTVTCSIGIALYPNDGDNMDELIKNADSAMYAVKERGRSGFRFYTRQMNIGLLSRVKLDHAIRLALKNDAFRLQYQPQVSLKSGDIIGTEALIRWRDAELGEVPPSRFIPIAEDSGAIIPLGDWVLRRAAQQAAVWYRQGVRVVTSVNVSALQFQQAEFVEKVADALQSNGLPPQLFELELTESILIQNIDETLKRLQALAQLGVQLAIDDFGTGYSSLAYLKRFPIQKLKIDQSFVRDIPADESDAAIVRAIINLGHSMNLCVIAEGVESESQQTFLQSAGCDEFQGFLYSPALESEIIEKLLLQRCRLEKTDTERSTQQ